MRTSSRETTIKRFLQNPWKTSFNVAFFLLFAYVLIGPDGALAVKVSRWRRQTKTQALISREWASAVNAESRWGKISGPIRVIIFSDYECPFCRQTHSQLQKLLRSGSFAIVYRHLPSQSHPAARGAARAVICAEAQGRFRELHDLLFETVDWKLDTNWYREAAKAGVSDLGRFRECLTSKETAARLTTDSLLAQKLLVLGTPTFFTNSARHDGAMPDAELRRLLRIP